MKSHLHVHWWDGSLVGHLVNKGSIYFVYDEAWIKRGDNLSPLSLPFTTAAFNGGPLTDGLPGLISDCLPDDWGRKVARKIFASNKWREPSNLSLLQWRSDRGLGALHFLPALEGGKKLAQQQAAITVAALAYGAAEIQRGTVSEVLPQLAQGGTAGGAYPKALVLLYDDGTLRASKPDGEGVPYLLKFDLSQENENAPCEHVYAIMAQAAGIKSVETTLIAESKTTARRHLLIKRFDIPDQKNPQRRLHFHSASGLLHKAPADLDYRDLFRVAIRLNVNPLELMEIARRMVFNVLGSNHDDHGKNHAFLYDEDQKTWSLTPAFDLNYTTGILERGMLVSGEVWPSFKTMEALCIDAGMTKKEFKKIFEEVDAAITQWPRFAKQAGVSSSMAQEIKERHRRIRNEVIRDY